MNETDQAKAEAEPAGTEKPHGDPLLPAGAKDGVRAAPGPEPSGDSPKRQGDELADAVRKAAGT